MKTKLTLSIEKSVIEEAKVLAKENGSSISAMFEEFLEKLIKERKYSIIVAENAASYEKALSPEVKAKIESFKKLVGIFKPKELGH